MTVQLMEFLLARIDEDAREPSYLRGFQVKGPKAASANAALTGVVKRVLEDCDAKRAIVRLHGRRDGVLAAYSACEQAPLRCAICMETDYPCRTLRLLAEPYADHYDHDSAWLLPIE